MGKIYFTKQGFDNFLKKIKEDEEVIQGISKSLGESVESGTWHDNFDYEQKKAKLDMLTTELAQKKELIRDSFIIDNKVNAAKGISRIGSTVTIDFGGETQKWQIVGYGESDPAAGKIAYNCRMGIALIKKKVGDSFDYETGAEKNKVKVVIKEIVG